MPKRSRFKQPKLDRKMVARIVAAYQAGGEGADWYWEAHYWCRWAEAEFGVDYRIVAGVVAALSPGCSWETNLQDAEKLLRGEEHAYATYPANVEKAGRILGAGVADVERLLAPQPTKSGFKVLRFWYHIVDPTRDDVAVVDRHALAVALGRPATLKERGMTRLQYATFELAYIMAARKLGVRVAVVQAVTWVAWRER